ncbi:hypothetical protein DV735_g5863, partial [Chaetothyriales sp. CBS 134920]
MPARTGTAPLRNIDFSAVGKAGRRTGITLPQQRLDEHGLEEMSHLFSSPKKPSPLKTYVLAEPYEEDTDNVTPRPTKSLRPTPRASIPRSASPRKSGISGRAKRASGLDIRSPKKAGSIDQPDGQENEPHTPSASASKISRRPLVSTSTKTPLRDITPNGALVNQLQTEEESEVQTVRRVVTSVEGVHPQPHDSPQPQHVTPMHQSLSMVQDLEDDGGPILDDDADKAVTEAAAGEEALDLPQTHVVDAAEEREQEEHEEDQEGDEQSITLDSPSFSRLKPQSVRKRRYDLEVPDTSPPPKRVARSTKVTNTSQQMTQVPDPPKAQKVGARSPLKKKDANKTVYTNQDKELDQAIERIKSRPNPPKSLYLLRRETPTDDTVTRTRSGRVSFKPLAYWRNERCIWGSSPSGHGIKDGARFPLNSIKEIILPEQDDQSSDSELDEDVVDPHAEEWETQRGTLHGDVAIWDSDLQQASKEEEQIEIAIARAAIEKTSIHHPNEAEPEFKYAKLLGNSFMGAGLVDLPPGGIKRTKNSKKMHMTFYVVKGRVTVTVGSILSEPNRFSIGKGGFWQVPRGNQYSIENELERPARVFFSQGCEVEVGLDDE